MDKTLKFNNGKFRIMSLGDIHESIFADDRNKRKRTEDMHNLIRMGILSFKPDLIVLLGDTLCPGDLSEDFNDYKIGLERVLKPILDSGIPFCYVLGNHEHDLKKEDIIVKAYSEIPTMIGVNDTTAPRGNFNCNILVRNSEDTDDILNLWFIDSNNCCDDRNVSHYDWVHEDQIKWYEEKVQRIKDEHNGKTIPAILFQHIPVYEEYELLREAKPLEYPVAVKGTDKFSDKMYVLKDGVEGYLGEGPCPPSYNGGQFASWKRMGDVVAAFFGHDHTNDFTGYVDGIMLGQNKTSGFCCYTDGARSAIRITTVDESDPRKPESKIYHFKELGLQPTCLGPIESWISDRQSMNLHKVGYAAAGIAGVAGIATVASKLSKKLKKD